MRNITDATQKVDKALPAAGAANQSASLDLAQGGHVPEAVEIEISAPALPALVDAKTATFLIEESADDASWADAPWSPTLTLTGAGGTGAAAASLRLAPPSDAKRFVRLAQAVEAAGGDNTAVSGTLRFLF